MVSLSNSIVDNLEDTDGEFLLTSDLSARRLNLLRLLALLGIQVLLSLNVLLKSLLQQVDLLLSPLDLLLLSLLERLPLLLLVEGVVLLEVFAVKYAVDCLQVVVAILLVAKVDYSLEVLVATLL